MIDLVYCWGNIPGKREYAQGESIYVDRIAGGDRNHCNSAFSAASFSEEGQGACQTDKLC
jgi:hypothetical protein